jgi:hypothetical protein
LTSSPARVGDLAPRRFSKYQSLHIVGDAVSRILRRLLDLGLAVNHNGGKDPGGPNAWQLTLAGVHAADAAARSSIKA